MKKLYLAQIPNGEPLHEDLFNSNGAILVPKGKIMTPRLRQQLLRSNIEYFLLDATGFNEVDHYLEHFEMETVKEIEEVRKVYTESVKNISNEFERMRKIGNLDKKVVEETAHELVESIGRHQQVYLGLEGIRRKDFYTYIHSIDVAVFMIVLGKSLKLDRKQQERAAMAGLLHDIGKTRIHDNILLKPARLTDEEMRVMQEHSRIGHEILTKELRYPADIACAALEHHERMDGTGYPHGVNWEKLHLHSKMAAVCDIYDAITGERVYKKAMLPHEAVEFLMTIVDKHLDRSLTTQFVRNISVYPLGTRVTLNNQEEGIVVRLHDGYPTRPVVKVPRKGTVRDLLIEQTIMIERVHDPREAAVG
ncbi:HD-GYP domain-containing protein [Anoxynatronum buryatiense]|uniref:HDIG domain-containing protein n=1 Tax=Anoxynatronum buryatiense TaxID=489973 RepID=A0AA46AJG3_9CLOT|nr:HD-GYP domain-containing protein [Anoxynatronum buryatiense]SMP61412.1 HDIG domain-containing protein [Anoxynatronum buryatiense]